MSERRHNWKAGLSKRARERAEKRQSLFVQLDMTREEIKNVGTDFVKYDELKMKQRIIAAELATL